MKLYGLSSALLFGDQSSTITLANLEGARKGDISLASTHSVQIHNLKSDTDVGNGFKEFLDAIVSTAHRQKAEPPPKPNIKISAPVVFGFPLDGPINRFLTGLRRKFRLELKGVDKESTIENIEALVNSTLKKNGLSPYDISFQMRGFDKKVGCSSAEGNCKKTKEVSEKTPGYVPDPELCNKLLELKVKYDHGDEKAKETLNQITIWLARSYADMYGRMGYDGSSRFFLLGLKEEPFLSNVKYNFITWYNLREIFQTELRKELGIRHNIVVKAPRDPKSPPFFDVAYTYMADCFDWLESMK